MKLTCLLAALLPFALAAKTMVEQKEKPYYVDKKYWRAVIGDICQLPEYPRPSGNPDQYLECLRTVTEEIIEELDEQEAYIDENGETKMRNLTRSLDQNGREDLGVWTLQKCLNGYEFVPFARRCRPISTVRRQQAALCAENSLFCGPSPIAVAAVPAPAQPCGCPTPGMTGCMCSGPTIIQPALKLLLQPAPLPPPACGCREEVTCPCPAPAPFNHVDCPCPLVTRTVCVPCPPHVPGPVIHDFPAPHLGPVGPLPPPQPHFPAPVPHVDVVPAPAPLPFPHPGPAPFIHPAPHVPFVHPAPHVDVALPIVQPQPCPQAACQGGGCAQENGVCSWMLDPLMPHPQDRNSFLQCQPAPWNVFCGRWRRMPCARHTMFDAGLQVCVHDPNAPIGPLPPPMPIAVPSTCGCSVGMQIGQCGQNYQCPGMSVCQVSQAPASPCGACCYFGMKFFR